MSMRMNVPRRSALATSRSTFAYARSSLTSSPRCVSLSATLASSLSADQPVEHLLVGAGDVLGARLVGYRLAEDASCWCGGPGRSRARSTATHSSSVTPATKRPAPSFMPCRCTRRCRRGLSAALRTAVRGSWETVAPTGTTGDSTPETPPGSMRRPTSRPAPRGRSRLRRPSCTGSIRNGSPRPRAPRRGPDDLAESSSTRPLTTTATSSPT